MQAELEGKTLKAKRLKSVLIALLVTFLWSTSWVLIKIGLQEIPPLTFAGIRYFMAATVLLPGLLTRKNRGELASLGKRDWLEYIAYGIVAYSLTQGFQFLSINLLPAATSSLILNFTPLIVALLSIPLLKEKPLPRHWFGLSLFFFGLLFYFSADGAGKPSIPGIVFGILGLVSNAFSSIIGRGINRKHDNAFLVTTLSMLVGGSLLFLLAIAIQGMPAISVKAWGIIAWLAVVNGALAFTLWNYSLQELTATDSSIIANTMLIQIALLAWIFLGETIPFVGIVGLAFALVGTFIAQYERKILVATSFNEE